MLGPEVENLISHYGGADNPPVAEIVEMVQDPRGWGAVPKPRQKAAKIRDAHLYSASVVAVLAGKHVEPAIRELARLMKHSKRDQVRLRAATTLIELAIEADVSADGRGGTNVYILSPNQNIPAAAEEARKRLLAATQPKD